MKNNYSIRMYFTPSIYSHVISGGVLLAGVIYLALYSSKIMSRDPYQLLVLILLISISVGLHGISHMGLETVYNYNPLSLSLSLKQNEAYHPLDCPYRRANCPYFKDNSI